jgi:hypothetical protein
MNMHVDNSHASLIFAKLFINTHFYRRFSNYSARYDDSEIVFVQIKISKK